MVATSSLFLVCCYFQGFMVVTTVFMLYEMGTFKMQMTTEFIEPTLRLFDKPLPSAIIECPSGDEDAQRIL